MKISLNITLACTIISFGFLTKTQDASAALLVYDGFDYAAGNVNAENGGAGWSSGWVSSTSPVYGNVVTGTPLSYTGGTISVNGSGSALSITGGGSGVLNRPFVAASSATDLYFSFLFRSVSGSGNEFFQFYLSDAPDLTNSGGIGDFNSVANDARFGARINDGTADTTANSALSYTTGVTYLLVGRLSTDGSSGASANIVDRLELWVNPTSLTPGTANATANASTGLTISDFDTFSSRMVNFAAPDEILLDELKIGTTFASVVPEPNAGGLLFLGAIGLWVGRRKKA